MPTATVFPASAPHTKADRKRLAKNEIPQLIAELRRLDPENWNNWWDSDAVPERGTLAIHEALTRRIAELKGC